MASVSWLWPQMPPAPLPYAGTFGEAFREGEVVIKIVPFDGETPVNGEVQKRSTEIKAEIAVGLTLSQLRGSPGKVAP